MAQMRKRRKKGCARAALLPVVLSFAPLSSRPVPAALLLCLSIFYAAAVVPAYRRHENTAVFLMTAGCGVPLNLRLTIAALRFMEFGAFLFVMAYGLFIMLVLFSMEEILLGLAARWIWKEQEDLPLEITEKYLETVGEN